MEVLGSWLQETKALKKRMVRVFTTPPTLAKEEKNQIPYTTDGFVFASFSQREAEMVDRAAAIIVAPGGFGTEWEIFETLSKIQTNKKKPVPIILLGRKRYWKSLLARINYLKSLKTISPEDVQLLKQIESPKKAIKFVANFLNLAQLK